MLQRFDTIPDRGRQTDGVGRTPYDSKIISRLYIASRG